VETLGARPETKVMVGDGETDVKTARAGALQGIVLVNHGYSARPVATLGADAVINHLHEFVEGLALTREAQ